jgi:arylsulfatase A-like enzyme
MTRLDVIAILSLLASYGHAQDKPNILWIVQEDTSPWMGCYGHEVNKGKTPVVDKLARDGVLFTRAYVPAPVCSPCRSAFIVGAYQFRFGAHEHRSRRGKAAKPLPEGMKTIPELMLEAGYATFNAGKTDYNFSHGAIYAGGAAPERAQKGKKGRRGRKSKGSKSAPWRALPKGKPFFGQIQLKGGKSSTGSLSAGEKTDPGTIRRTNCIAAWLHSTATRSGATTRSSLKSWQR